MDWIELLFSGNQRDTIFLLATMSSLHMPIWRHVLQSSPGQDEAPPAPVPAELSSAAPAASPKVY